MADADFYRRKAEECVRLAEAAADERERRLLRALERDFLSKAADAERSGPSVDSADPLRRF